MLMFVLITCLLELLVVGFDDVLFISVFAGVAVCLFMIGIWVPETCCLEYYSLSDLVGFGLLIFVLFGFVVFFLLVDFVGSILRITIVTALIYFWDYYFDL